MKKLFVIDWSGFLFRAYYAFPEMFDSEWNNVNVVYGFFRMILKIFYERPDYFIIAWDSPIKTKRHEQYPEYKANRTKTPDDFKRQIPIIQEIVNKLKIPSLIAPGYEADDIIYSVAKKFWTQADMNVSIYSADKDLKQLLWEYVDIIDPMKNRRIKVKDFLQEFLFEPIYIVDYLALIGDSADNIKWVNKIGPKTAIKLVQEFKSLDNIYDNLDNIDEAVRNKLINGKKEAFESKKLIQLLDVPDLKLELEDNKLVLDFFEYEDILVKETGLYSMSKVIQDLKNKFNTPEQTSLFG